MHEEYSRGGLGVVQLSLGGDRNFSYLLSAAPVGSRTDDTLPGAVVDPGFAPDDLFAFAQAQQVRIEHILITHGHSDHVGGAVRLAELTGAPVRAGAAEAVTGALPLTDDDEFRLAGQTIRALATPGHSPGHFCFLFGDNLMTGDLLFCGKVGGTGPFFEGSSSEQEYESLARVLTLPDDTRIFPGHDYYGGPGEQQHSTVGFEREHNPFLTVADFEAFCQLKENWAAYKKEHGIR